MNSIGVPIFLNLCMDFERHSFRGRRRDRAVSSPCSIIETSWDTDWNELKRSDRRKPIDYHASAVPFSSCLLLAGAIRK